MEKNHTFHFQGKEIQIKVINNEPWFLVANIAKILSYTDASNMVKNANIKDYHVRIILNNTNNVHREMLFVDKLGLYKLLFKSKKTVAEKLQDWVNEQVLPSIIKTEDYNINENATLPVDYKLQSMKAQAELQSIKAQAELISSEAEKFSQEQKLLHQKQSFFEMMVNYAINFEKDGNLQMAAVVRESIKNALLNSYLIDTKSVSIDTKSNPTLNFPESALEVSVRLGYKIPRNFDSALGKAVKKKCEDLLIGKSAKYSKADYLKLNANVYPPNNKRVEDAVIEYCKNKNFSTQPLLSIVK